MRSTNQHTKHLNLSSSPLGLDAEINRAFKIASLNVHADLHRPLPPPVKDLDKIGMDKVSWRMDLPSWVWDSWLVQLLSRLIGRRARLDQAMEKGEETKREREREIS